MKDRDFEKVMWDYGFFRYIHKKARKRKALPPG